MDGSDGRWAVNIIAINSIISQGLTDGIIRVSGLSYESTTTLTKIKLLLKESERASECLPNI